MDLATCFRRFGSAWRSGNGRPVSELPDSDCEVFSPCAAAALIREAIL